MTIALTDVTKVYGAQTVAVRGINLEIQDGEFFTLLGPSGCGKTTTLRMIAGLEAVTSGTIALRGRDVTDVPARDRDVAMVFQSYALYPHMTVRDNLGLNLQVRKLPKKEIASASTASRACSSSRDCSTASRASSPAASGSASRSAGPSSGGRMSSSWTSRSPISISSCARRRGPS